MFFYIKKKVKLDDLRVHPLHHPRSYEAKEEFDVIKCTK